jgi:hypothetical protein
MPDSVSGLVATILTVASPAVLLVALVGGALRNRPQQPILVPSVWAYGAALNLITMSVSRIQPVVKLVGINTLLSLGIGGVLVSFAATLYIWRHRDPSYVAIWAGWGSSLATSAFIAGSRPSSLPPLWNGVVLAMGSIGTVAFIGGLVVLGRAVSQGMRSSQ